jgi:hypothetical protein
VITYPHRKDDSCARSSAQLIIAVDASEHRRRAK